jgi:adenylate kinase family enzyme
VTALDAPTPSPAPNIVFVLGGPGAGKGTVCVQAAAQLGWTHLSTGDLLRAARAAGGPLGATIDEYIAAGKLVPNEIVVTLLVQAMDEVIRTTAKKDFLLDGFPRSLSNLEAWYDVVGRDAALPPMLYLACPYPVLEQRILGRALVSGRTDDNVESIKLRFETFKAETLPTVEFFQREHTCVEVDTSPDPATVFATVSRILARFAA